MEPLNLQGFYHNTQLSVLTGVNADDMLGVVISKNIAEVSQFIIQLYWTWKIMNRIKDKQITGIIRFLGLFCVSIA